MMGCPSALIGLFKLGSAFWKYSVDKNKYLRAFGEENKKDQNINQLGGTV